MKKLSHIKIYIWLLPLLIIILCCLIIISYYRKTKTISYFVNEQIYYIENIKPSVIIDIYSTEQSNEYLKKENINYSTLNNEEELYEIQLKQITIKEKPVSYQNNLYYCYQLKYELPFDIKEHYQMNDIILSLKYFNEEELKFKIGKIIIYRTTSSDDLTISRLKGVVNKIDDISTLVGIGFSINTKEDIIITNIISLDESITFQTENLLVLDNCDYLNNIPISEIIQKEYNYLNTLKNQCNLVLNKEELTHYLITLGYNDVTTINKLAFLIEYQKNGITYYQLIHPFVYFNTVSVHPEVIKYAPNHN